MFEFILQLPEVHKTPAFPKSPPSPLWPPLDSGHWAGFLYPEALVGSEQDYLYNLWGLVQKESAEPPVKKSWRTARWRQQGIKLSTESFWALHRSHVLSLRVLPAVVQQQTSGSEQTGGKAGGPGITRVQPNPEARLQRSRGCADRML